MYNRQEHLTVLFINSLHFCLIYSKVNRNPSKQTGMDRKPAGTTVDIFPKGENLSISIKLPHNAVLGYVCTGKTCNILSLNLITFHRMWLNIYTLS